MATTYQDIEFVDRGRFATVLRARNLSTNQYVALKKMWIKSSLHGPERSHSLQPPLQPSSYGPFVNGSYANSETSTNVSSPSPRIYKNYLAHCIEREIKILKTINNHPNIIKLLDTYNQDEYVIIVLEYMNIDLHQLLQNLERNLTELECKHIAKQLFEGLDALHTNSIVHRDLKPANILFNQDGLLKIADLGQARTIYKIPNNSNQHHNISSNNNNHNQNKNKINNNSNNYSNNHNNNEDEAKSEPAFSAIVRGSQISLCNKKDKQQQNDNGFGPMNIRQMGGSIVINEIEDDDDYDNNNNMADIIQDDNYGHLTNEVGTRWYKSPELLYGTRRYSFSIDIWSAGCIIAEMLQMKPLFCGETDIDQLCKIFNILGTINLKYYSDAANLPDFNKIVFNEIEAKPLSTLLPDLSHEIIDLIECCLKLNPNSRISANDALRHPWFILNKYIIPNKITNDDENVNEENMNENNEIIMDHQKIQEIKTEAMCLKQLNTLIVNATVKLNEERKRKMESFNNNNMDEDEEDDEVISITSEILNECDLLEIESTPNH